MLKKIEKNQENKFVINAILPLKTFLNFEKNTKVWSKIPYITTERFSWKFQNSKIYPSVFALEKDCMFWEKKVEPGQNALNSGPSRCYKCLLQECSTVTNLTANSIISDTKINNLRWLAGVVVVYLQTHFDNLLKQHPPRQAS